MNKSRNFVVLGAGPMGLITLIVAKQMGVARVLVSQTSPTRRELATRFGADATFDPRAADLAEQVMAYTDVWGADAFAYLPAVDLVGELKGQRELW